MSHGHAPKSGVSPTYRCWQDMKNRCYRPATRGYENYGGRGIEVCERWRNSFEAFLADMGEQPFGLTIERNDNDKDYEPGNCSWATRTEQSYNNRRTVFLELGMFRSPLKEWARALNLNYWTLHMRYRRGWTPQEIIYGRG